MDNKREITQDILDKAFDIVNKKSREGPGKYVITSSNVSDAIIKIMSVRQRKDKINKIQTIINNKENH